jgi:hypothetical protein
MLDPFAARTARTTGHSTGPPHDLSASLDQAGREKRGGWLSNLSGPCWAVLVVQRGEKTMITEAQINEAHAQAIVSKGPRKGYLKKTCPPMGTLAAAYWQGVMMELNPHRVSIAQMIFFTPEQQALFDGARKSAADIIRRRKAS